MADDPYKYFRIEARELHGELTKGVLNLEKDAPVHETVNELLRHAHTLKGAARIVKHAEIAERAHDIEEVLDPFRESVDIVPKTQLDLLLGHLDAVGSALDELPAHATAATAMPSTTAMPPGRSIRTEVVEIDALLDGIREAHARLASLQSELHRVEKTRSIAEALASHVQLGRSVSSREGGAANDDRVQTMAHELRTAVSTIAQHLRSGSDELDRELGQVRHALERLRLVPASDLFNDLERASRDAAEEQGKRVVFEARGGEVRLDAHVLVGAQGALQQIVRNAVVHGIESERERLARGKTAEGHVTVEIIRSGGRARFICHDDGGGIDLEAVRDVALRKGVAPDVVSTMSPEELTQIVLRGGISTASSVTELSGRGIGLNMARESAARLGGSLTVTSESGHGTSVTFDVPLSLAAFDALIVEVDGQTILVPIEFVTHARRVASDELRVDSDGERIVHDGSLVPVVRLGEIFSHGTPPPRHDAMTVVFLQTKSSGLVAVAVTRLAGTTNVAILPLPDSAPRVPLVSGIWLDAESKPVLVLDPEGLTSAPRQFRVDGATGGPESSLPVLVVDDSLTSRMLEQSILESVGYHVDVASSGEEALRKVKEQRYLVILVDVEMPGIDGFTFIEQIRLDPELREVPAILVTSRAAPEDLRRGFAVGANAYVTKGDFDQGVLLEHIRSLTVR